MGQHLHFFMQHLQGTVYVMPRRTPAASVQFPDFLLCVTPGALSSIKITWAIPSPIKVPNGQNKHNSSGNMINISINGLIDVDNICGITLLISISTYFKAKTLNRIGKIVVP